MSSRDAILAAVRAAQPAEVPLPGVPVPESTRRDLAQAFSAALEAASATVVFHAADELWDGLAERFGSRMAAAPGSGLPDDVERIDSDTALANLDVLVCRGALGVAENGAVWLPESRCGHRAAPFLALHVVLVVERSAIVPTMHEAYARIDAAAEGFGVFVAGPSKTADIEQALVIGAHGPLELTVAIVE